MLRAVKQGVFTKGPETLTNDFSLIQQYVAEVAVVEGFDRKDSSHYTHA